MRMRTYILSWLTCRPIYILEEKLIKSEWRVGTKRSETWESCSVHLIMNYLVGVFLYQNFFFTRTLS